MAEKDLTGVGVGVGVSLFYPRRLPPPEPGRHPSGDLGIRVLGPSFHTHLVYSNAVPCTYLALLTSQMKKVDSNNPFRVGVFHRKCGQL